MTENTITPASHWRKPYSEGVPVALPTGTVVRLRPCYVSHLLRENFVPDALLAMVAQERSKSPRSRTQEDERQELLSAAEFSRKVCKLMFVYPRIVDNPSADDEISIDMLDDAEINFVAGLFNRPVEVLRSFRPQPTADVASVDTPTGDEQTGE